MRLVLAVRFKKSYPHFCGQHLIDNTLFRPVRLRSNSSKNQRKLFKYLNSKILSLAGASRKALTLGAASSGAKAKGG